MPIQICVWGRRSVRTMEVNGCCLVTSSSKMLIKNLTHRNQMMTESVWIQDTCGFRWLHVFFCPFKSALSSVLSNSSTICTLTWWNFSVGVWTFHMRKPLSKIEGLFILLRSANTRGNKFPLPFCFGDNKGCGSTRVLLCLHLCGLDCNNGVVLQRTSTTAVLLAALSSGEPS